MSLEKAKLGILVIENDLISLIGPILSTHCRPSEAVNGWQFFCRALRLEGCLLAYGWEKEKIQKVTNLIALADQTDDLHAPPPISGVFLLSENQSSAPA
jgi:hypothetical protein